MIWPTSNTLWYLLAGLLPFAYLGWQILQNGRSELFSLRVLVVFILWVGYQLSPWIAFIQGDYWDSSLLSPAYLDTAILFSALSMSAILIGYQLVFRKAHVRYRRSREYVWTVPRIHWKWVLLFAIVLLAFSIYTRGGFADFWDASYSRGEGQWRERTLLVRLERMLNVSVAPLTVVLTVLGALHILYRPSRLSHYIVGLSAIIIAMLPSMHGFSRMAGFPLFLFAFLIFRLYPFTRTSLISVVLLSAIAISMGQVGIDQRGYYTSGVGNFLHAAFVGSAPRYSSNNGSIIDPGRNSLDASAPFTRQVEALEVLGEDFGLRQLPKFLFHINPVPSGIVDPGRIGIGLSEYMGTIGSTGLTTPALADIFKAFGYGGLLVLMLLGCVFGYFDRYALFHKGVMAHLAILLVVIGTGISLHSGIRAWTRPMLYAALLIGLVNLVNNRLSRNTLLTGRGRR